jgi:hypothetical protein
VLFDVAENSIHLFLRSSSGCHEVQALTAKKLTFSVSAWLLALG